MSIEIRNDRKKKNIFAEREKAMGINNDRSTKESKILTSDNFRIVFEGKIVKGAEASDVMQRMGKLLNKDVSEIQKLFSGLKIILKKNASYETCERIRKKLLEVGAKCLVEKEPEPQTNTSLAIDACPKKPGNPSDPGTHQSDTQSASKIENANPKVVQIEDYQNNKANDNLDYTDIIQNISTQLTGATEIDIAYLENQIETYANHKYSVEISRAIGRLIYDVLPPNEKNKLLDLFAKLDLSTDIILNEAKRKIQEGDLYEAERFIAAIIPDNSFFKEDKVSIFFCFNNPFEEIFYNFIFKPEKEIRQIPNFDTERFLVYAYILIEQGKLDKALKTLDAGLNFNPIDLKLLFEKSEIYKKKKDWQNFKKLNDFSIKYSYTPEDIARAYRNYGYMYIELEDFDTAICCYLASISFEGTEMAQSQLFYISQKLKKTINQKKYSRKLSKILDKKTIQFGASEDVLGVAYAMGENYEKDGQYDGAIYYFSILYSLTDNSEIMTRIEKLQKAIEIATIRN